jgi:hypothetical protein
MKRAVPHYFPSKANGGKGYDAFTPLAKNEPGGFAFSNDYTSSAINNSNMHHERRNGDYHYHHRHQQQHQHQQYQLHPNKNHHDEREEGDNDDNYIFQHPAPMNHDKDFNHYQQYGGTSSSSSSSFPHRYYQHDNQRITSGKSISSGTSYNSSNRRDSSTGGGNIMLKPHNKNQRMTSTKSLSSYPNGNNQKHPNIEESNQLFMPSDVDNHDQYEQQYRHPWRMDNNTNHMNNRQYYGGKNELYFNHQNTYTNDDNSSFNLQKIETEPPTDRPQYKVHPPSSIITNTNNGSRQSLHPQFQGDYQNHNNNLIMFRDAVPELDDDDTKSLNTNWSQRHLLQNNKEDHSSVNQANPDNLHKYNDDDAGYDKGDEHQKENRNKASFYSPIVVLKIKNKGKKKSYLKPKAKSNDMSSRPKNNIMSKRDANIVNTSFGSIGLNNDDMKTKQKLEQNYYANLEKQKVDSVSPRSRSKYITSTHSQSKSPTLDKPVGRGISDQNKYHRHFGSEDVNMNVRSFHSNASNGTLQKKSTQQKVRQYKVWADTSETEETITIGRRLWPSDEKKKVLQHQDTTAFSKGRTVNYSSHETVKNVPLEPFHEVTTPIDKQKSTPKINAAYQKPSTETPHGPLASLFSPVYVGSHSHDEMSPIDMRLGIRPHDFYNVDTTNATKATTSKTQRVVRNEIDGRIPLNLQSEDQYDNHHDGVSDHVIRSKIDVQKYDDGSESRNIGQGIRYKNIETVNNSDRKIRKRLITRGGQKVIEKTDFIPKDVESYRQQSDNQHDNKHFNGIWKQYEDSTFQKKKSDDDCEDQSTMKHQLDHDHNVKENEKSTRVGQVSKVGNDHQLKKAPLETKKAALPIVPEKKESISDSFEFHSKIVNQSWAPSPIKVEGSFAIYNQQDTRKSDNQQEEEEFIRTVAAIVIQTFFRRHLAYRLTLERYSAVITIQRFFRFLIDQRKPSNEESIILLYDVAATQIQAAWRGWWVRDCVEVDKYCATVIQRNVRIFLYKCRQEYLSAIQIQKTWRGHHWRKILLKQRHQSSNDCTTTLKSESIRHKYSGRIPHRPNNIERKGSEATHKHSNTSGSSRPKNVARQTSKGSQTSSQKLLAIYEDDILRKWREMQERNRRGQNLAEF